MPIETIENTWITLADGRRLAARIWLPETDPAPAILEYLPYRKRDGTAPRDETTHTVFAEAGYACIRVDIAGTGDSEGQFDDEYSEQELLDGEEVIAWIAAQDWCDGFVGMIGISWGGFNGLQLAFRQPPALKAVVSVASTVDRYADDIHFMGGCLLSDNMNWGSQMFAYLTRPADPELRADWREDWLARLQNVPFSAADWLRHPTRDSFWKHGSVCEDWSAIQTPVLAITGWADAYVNAPPALVANLTVPAKAVIGPWEHRYAHISKLDPADFHSEVIGWFDRWLKGQENGAEDLPAYRTYMQEHFNPTAHNSPRQGRWIAEATWPSPHVSEQVWHLTKGGFSQESTSGTVAIASPCHIGADGGYFCAGMRIDNELAGDQARDDALSVCFDSAPLQAPLELLGRAKLKFQFSVDQPVAQLVARLCDVSPDGVSQRISYRSLNVCHYHSHETPQTLEPGQIYEAEIALNECAHHLRGGHVLRLALSTSYWPIVWPAPNSAEVTLHLQDCALHLPVREVTREIHASEPGPAQTYPVLEAEPLRTPSAQSERMMTDDGRVVLETFDDYGKTRDPYHDLIVGSDVRMHYGIHPDDPATAVFETAWNFTFERADWQVAISTECRMTCDAQNFYLYRKLRATEGADEIEVLTQEWSETVPRGLL
ncbi:CocE/NonD family hydrolase [Ruegeria arenilitoris]|uniref:CocE/NonD family hydrolase n=1 Tax=Ruegeria arenilitoris TaxID=1173585 RepID=UPI00147F92B0|nr:CocE/NonD family hydrolase [Ruegeria arenilitoris]